MPETRGSWTLHEAVVCRWEDANLDITFRSYWPVTTETRYNPLHDTEARPTPPGPYCEYEINEGTIDGHNSGKAADEEGQYVRIPVEFRIHAKSTSTRSGKAIARDLAKKVAEAFDPGNLFGPLPIKDDAHHTTHRGTDFPIREGDTEWSWTLQYDIVLEAEYDSPRS